MVETENAPLVECVTLYGDRIMLPRSRLSWRPSVYAIVHRESPADPYGQILLVKIRLTGRYTLPGGGQELGELAEVALIREVREESGLTVRDPEHFCEVEEFRYYDPKDEATHVIARVFLCQPDGDGEIEADTGDETAAGAEWVGLTDIGRMLALSDPTTRFHEIAITALSDYVARLLPPPL